MESLLGRMAGNILECIRMMKKKDKAFLNGRMEGNIRVSGRMGNSMGKESIQVV